ncbi:protocatechuate 3,4-dioxygenase subunit beta [Pelagibius sp.]|uniref:dioxygenase family protein n=1 Tax=Pelagibius sp. TaxID=1931238 RepID=UPI003BAEE79F
MTYPIITTDERRVPLVLEGDTDSICLTPLQPLVDVGLGEDPLARPLFPRPFLREGENDITRIAPGRLRADGEVIGVTGQILDDEGRPLRHTLVEMWNANTHGRYTHVHCPESTGPLDPNFHGCGRTLTDGEGRYQFITIKPGPYLAESEIDWWRPSHLHFSVFGGGTRLVTQMLFPDDAMIQKDLIWLHVLDEARRTRMIAETCENYTNESDVRCFTFNIVVRGPLQSVMEDG